MQIKKGNVFLDRRNGSHLLVIRIKNGKVSFYDMSQSRKRQRPVSLCLLEDRSLFKQMGS